MSDEPAPPSESSARLAALIKRSGELAKEMKATSEKMEALTAEMARETRRRSEQADAAKKRAGEK